MPIMKPAPEIDGPSCSSRGSEKIYHAKFRIETKGTAGGSEYSASIDIGIGASTARRIPHLPLPSVYDALASHLRGGAICDQSRGPLAERSQSDASLIP